MTILCSFSLPIYPIVISVQCVWYRDRDTVNERERERRSEEKKRVARSHGGESCLLETLAAAFHFFSLARTYAPISVEWFSSPISGETFGDACLWVTRKKHKLNKSFRENCNWIGNNHRTTWINISVRADIKYLTKSLWFVFVCIYAEREENSKLT